ncbi:hypothetical protein K439DRAFT_1646238 [Ramaria rubella]|nr:hypothetical protein K439DRAFT_1646238 [Ramaria rubella]
MLEPVRRDSSLKKLLLFDLCRGGKHRLEGKPWAPFRTRGDFEFAELAVQSAMRSKVTAKFLQAITHDWTDPGHSQLTFTARTFNVQFKSGIVMATFNGEEHTFEFQFRDPWEWILNLTTDPSLASSILWYPVEKTLHENGTQTRLYDEINSGNTWSEIQDQLPVVPDLPHCFLPLHLWMDKGKVSTTVTMHPILLRPGFLPGPIRNGSGNGGAVLLGYMPKVVVPDVKKSQQIPFALFKREVYHKILRKIFSSLIDPSKYGQAVKCGDSIHHVLFPGFYILSLDGEEAACACATRGSKANHPCPRCLVHTDQLHNLTTPNFVARTSANMWAIWQEAQSARTKTAVEEILKNNGLHNIRICSKNVFWALGNSDPYAACAYDTLHAVELGVWGHHLFPLILDLLAQSDNSGQYAQNMSQMPRWPNLKHFQDVIKISFSDGQSYFDILKVSLFCLVQLFPLNSPIIPCIHALACFRMLISLHAITELQLERLQKYLEAYEYWCSKVGKLYGKDFNFPKQHAPTHLKYDIMCKGATSNYSTCAYGQTNFKNVAMQMTQIDENHEGIAQICMAVDAHDAKLAEQLHDKHNGKNKLGKAIHRAEQATALKQNWILGSHDKATTSSNIIIPCKCIYLFYQFMENWNTCEDIACCNPFFHGHPRYDCVIINSNPVSYARLGLLFKCVLDSNTTLNMALVKTFKKSTWLPRTKWEGCQVFEEEAGWVFTFVKYFTCSCHMVPAFGGKKGVYYLNDMIDGDMFI